MIRFDALFNGVSTRFWRLFIADFFEKTHRTFLSAIEKAGLSKMGWNDSSNCDVMCSDASTTLHDVVWQYHLMLPQTKIWMSKRSYYFVSAWRDDYKRFASMHAWCTYSDTKKLQRLRFEKWFKEPELTQHQMLSRSTSVSKVGDMSWEDLDDDLLPVVAPYVLYRQNAGLVFSRADSH